MTPAAHVRDVRLSMDVVIGLVEGTSAVDDPARGDRLTDLRVALQVRFEAAGGQVVIHRAVAVGRAAVADRAPGPVRDRRLPPAASPGVAYRPAGAHGVPTVGAGQFRCGPWIAGRSGRRR